MNAAQLKPGVRRAVASGICGMLIAGCAWMLYSAELFSRRPLVVYCAHDSIYADAVLRDFENQTGIRVSPRFDTEATKSLGLVNLLIEERGSPRCDVFWNNEPLGTMQLRREGVLLPYRGSGFQRIPDAYKDSEGHWTGFAARMRVQIVNVDKLSPTEVLLSEAMQGDLSRFALAKPLYGTTLVHYSLLWRQWGGERLRAWHNDIHRRHAREAAGNAAVKDLVAEGTCDFGWTDTDDYFVARDENKPVAMLPVRLENGSAICIPNTVAIIQGTRRLADAQRLVDFLLSAETELALARSKSRQIPLGDVPAGVLPAEVKELRGELKGGADLSGLEDARHECLQWLKGEYLR